MIEQRSCIGVFDKEEECDYIYGGEDFYLTDEDIMLLKQGKIINFDVNEEYGCTLRYKNSKIGKWNVYPTNYNNAFMCDSCHRLVETPSDFCPNCGADMRGN